MKNSTSSFPGKPVQAKALNLGSLPSFFASLAASNHKSRIINHKSRKGSVLLAVLGIIVIASLILMAFQKEAISRIRYYGLVYSRDDLRAEAYSWFDTTLAVIQEVRQIDGKIQSPNIQNIGSTSQILEYAQLEQDSENPVTIEVTDESGKFGVNKLAPEILAELLEAMDFDMATRSELADCFYDWLDQDDSLRLNGAESEYYKQLDPPLVPPNGPLQSLDDLLLIKGWREAFTDRDSGILMPKFEEFKNCLSLYHEGLINRHSASGLVLQTISNLEGFDSAGLTDYISGSDRQLGTVDDRLINDADPAFAPGGGKGGGASYSSTNANLLRVSVTVKRGDASFFLSSLVTVGQNSAGGNNGGGGRNTTGGGGRGQGGNTAGNPPGGGPRAPSIPLPGGQAGNRPPSNGTAILGPDGRPVIGQISVGITGPGGNVSGGSGAPSTGQGRSMGSALNGTKTGSTPDLTQKLKYPFPLINLSENQAF